MKPEKLTGILINLVIMHTCYCLTYNTHLHTTVGIVVGLENTTYQVTEDVGVVEICVVIFPPGICSLPVPLQFSLSTIGNTAGNYNWY